jgi:hypothetical protein
MCFLPVAGKKGTHRHIETAFVQTVTVNKAKLDEIASALGIRKAKLKPGTKIHIVGEKKKGR